MDICIVGSRVAYRRLGLFGLLPSSPLHAKQVIALSFEHGSEAAVRALADTLANVAPLVRRIVERRQEVAFRSIVEALVPEVPPFPAQGGRGAYDCRSPQSRT